MAKKRNSRIWNMLSLPTGKKGIYRDQFELWTSKQILAYEPWVCFLLAHGKTRLIGDENFNSETAHSIFTGTIDRERHWLGLGEADTPLKTTDPQCPHLHWLARTVKVLLMMRTREQRVARITPSSRGGNRRQDSHVLKHGHVWRAMETRVNTRLAEIHWW